MRDIRFDGLTVVPDLNEVVVDDLRIRLEPRLMTLLVALADRPGEVIGKDALLEAVWGARPMADEAVVVAIYALRKALGDSARRPRFIDTIPRRGYRWVAGPASAGLTSAPQPRAEGPRTRGRSGRPRPARWPVAAALAVAGAIGSVGWLVLPGASDSGLPAAVRDSRARPAVERAQALRDLRRPEAQAMAIRLLESAVGIDPRFAAAHAALIDAHLEAADLGFELPDLAFASAGRARELARSVGARSPEVASATAILRFMEDRDFARAEAALREALEAAPGDARLHQRYAWILGSQRRFGAAVRNARVAVAIDPASLAANVDLASAYVYAGDPRQALRQADRALGIDPLSLDALIVAAAAAAQTGQSSQAAAFYDRIIDLVARDAPAAPARLDPGQRIERSLEVWLGAAAVRARVGGGYYRIAYIQALLGQHLRSIEALERAVERREPGALRIAAEPAFAPLRDNPRFARLATTLGLPSSSSSSSSGS